jgi:hypothetical protein
VGETSGQITGEIARARAELGSNLRELEQKVRETADWRRQFQKSPAFMMALAFGGGLLLARLVDGGGAGR